LPSNADAQAALAGHLNDQAAFGPGATYLGIIDLATASRADGGNGNETFTAEVTLSVDTTSLPGGVLTLGLLNGAITNGSGFQSLDFRFAYGGNSEKHLFTSLAQARTFFGDNPIALGALPSDANYTLDFSLTLASTGGGDGFNGNLIVGVVPEPGELALSVLGGLVLLIAVQRTRRFGRAERLG